MTFPASPSNGQLVTVNSIVYQYSSSNNRWTRTLTPFGNLTITGNTTSNYLISTVITSPAGTGANIVVRPDGIGNVVIGNAAILYVTNNSANAVAVAGGVGVGGTVFAGNIVTTGATTTGNLITTTGVFWANGVSALAPTFGNINTAAYLPTYTGNVGAGNVIVASGVYSPAYFYANGTAFSSSSYGNTDVAGYLPTYLGNISAGNVLTNNYLYSNGTSILSSINTAIANIQANDSSFTTQISSINANVGTALSAIVTANSAVVAYVNTLNSAMASNVAGANAAIVTANSAVVSYVNTLNSNMAANLAGANAAIVVANSAVVAYVNTLNSAMAANVAGANAAIVTANLAVVAYVNTIANNITTGANANTAAYLTTAAGNISAGTISAAGQLKTTSNTNSTGLGTGALTISQGGASIFQDLWVGGNIYANVLNTVSTQILQVNEPLLYLQPNPTYPYSYDLGFYSHFVGGPANAYAHTGLVRNHLDGSWYLFSNVPEPAGNTLNLASPNIVYDTLKLGNINAVGTITVNGTDLFANISGLQSQVTGANAAIVTANSAVVSYVNTLNSAMAANVAGANTAISTANSAVVAYVNTLNSAMAANVAGANAAIVTANSAVVGLLNTTNANVTAANAAIATLQTQVYSNANVASYLPTYLGNIGSHGVAGNLTVYGNIVTANGVFYPNGSPYSSGSGSASITYQTYTSSNNTITTSANITTTGNIVGGGVRSTTSTSAPSNPTVGDIWYNSTTDQVARYTYDGVGSYWLDITGPTTANLTTPTFSNISATDIYGTLHGNLAPAVNGNIYITGNLIPDANVSYDLGSSTNWFRDLWLSAGTIHIGGAKISQDTATGSIAIIPAPTQSVPNPVATVISSAGGVSTVQTTAGKVTAAQINAVVTQAEQIAANNVNAISSTFGNVNTSGDVVIGGNLTVTGNIVAPNAMVYRGADQLSWDNITLMGTYLVNRNSWAGTTGTPLNSQVFTGTLEVNASGTSITQNYRPYDGSANPSVFWTRSQFNAGSWSGWVELTNNAEITDGGSF